MTTTLLAVDDSKTMRKVLEITFAGEEQYRTVLAASADEAVEKLRSDDPTVALVDATLGGTIGYDLCQKLKGERPGLGVILLSSKQQPYDRARGSGVGVDDFIDKPFDTQQLIDKVGGLLKKLAEAPAPAAAAAYEPADEPVPLVSPARPRTQTLAFGVPVSTAPSPAPVPQPPAAPPVAPPPLAGAAPVQRPPLPGPAGPAPAEPVRPVPETTVERAVAAPVSAELGGLEEKVRGLGLSSEQATAVLALSKEVIERVVWEVVPVLAETMIREEIDRLTRE